MKTQVIFEESELETLRHIMMITAQVSFNTATQAEKDGKSEKAKYYRNIYDYAFDQYTKLLQITKNSNQ